MKFTKKKLLKAPKRKNINLERVYRSLLIVPAGSKHESGFMHIAVIGVYSEDEKEKFEICSYPDDINWITPPQPVRPYKLAAIRTDCYYPQGILHFWSNYHSFKVGWGSSTEIELVSHRN